MSDPSSAKQHLIVHSKTPFNAEPPLPLLGGRFVTAQRDFYVRSHGSIPEIDPAAYRLRVGGLVGRPLELTLEELQSGFPPRTVHAVMQCAGNRRLDLDAVKSVSGDKWAGGAIGNASWTGVALADVLEAAEPAGLHVAFACSDEVTEEGQTFRYAVSIPLAKARQPDVLLAWAMNGEALTPEHGAPLRVVVPGYAGVRSAKWLAAIELRDSPADCPIQRTDYHLFPPDVGKAEMAHAKGMLINEMPINSAICEPGPGAKVPAGRTRLRGYAVGDARPITRVDVSADGGRNWVQAGLDADPAAPWSWTLWEAELELGKGKHELAVRAWDSAGQTQPSRPEETWNVKGYLCNAWHRVTVRAV